MNHFFARRNLAPHHVPSGLNHDFLGAPDLAFADYIDQTRRMIAKACENCTGFDVAKYTAANTPQEWRPARPCKTGIILIHGLYSSPFVMQDLGRYFYEQHFFVRSILLPGHGTRPADLVGARYHAWLKAVDYAIHKMAEVTQQLFLVGTSLGGTLATYLALCQKPIDGIVLLNPALRIKRQRFFPPLAAWWQLKQYLPGDRRWYIKRPFQQDYVKYESHCCSAPMTLYALIKRLYAKLQQQTVSIPVFMALCNEDAIVDPGYSLTLFDQCKHPHNRLLWYAKANLGKPHPLLTYRKSTYPDQNILDFAHNCLPIAPDNAHYGKHRDYQDFLIYPHNLPPANHKAIYLGEISPNNLKKHTIERLHYNPDFNYMAQKIVDFMRSIG